MQEEEIDKVVVKTKQDYCQLIIPAKKDWAAIYFLGFGLSLLVIVLIGLTLFQFSSQSTKEQSSLMFFIMPIILTVLIAPAFVWHTKGKEIITINNGIMTIDRLGMFFEPKSYNLAFIKNLRADFDDDSYEENKWNSTAKLKITVSLGGTFLFDYRGEQIKFGDSVDKDDADIVIQRLKKSEIFSSANFSE
jgi:hypothetical protein